jgi:hypothetical protein
MKVYIVMYDDGGNAYVTSVWANKEDAEKDADGFCYHVQEWEVNGLP